MIRLIVGLGNPGKEHEATRHNAGFWLVERFAARDKIALRKDAKFQALVGRMEGSNPAWLLLPQTFMNASGRPVQMLAGFFKIKPEEVLVVHDELDFEPGVARLKQGGGIAGHNGLRDISQRLGSHDYWRLRLGVGRPPSQDEGANYVLHRPSADERSAIDDAIERSIAVLPQCLSGDVQGAMQKLHTEQPKKAVEPKKAPEAKKPVEAKKPEAKKELPKEPEKPQEKAGLLKSLFGRK